LARIARLHRQSKTTNHGGEGTLIEIQLGDDDRLDWALKSFKKKVQKAGILADLRRKRHSTTPSEARQLKAAAARRRRRAAARRG
jgi:small subunit ribosomal protein S21